MPETASELQLRPTTLEDASIVADLEALRDPDAPPDPALLRHWWRMADELEKSMRRVAVRDGAAVAYVSVSHKLWEEDRIRYGTIRVGLRADLWTQSRFAQLVDTGETWLRDERAHRSVARVREDFERDLSALQDLGYRENRRMRLSELDLVAGRERAVRGRGIARALKYESMGQAVEDGHSRVRTNNDTDNPPILRINEEMGYRAVAPLIELHRELA